MRVLLDTNVWLATFLTHGACAELVEHLLMHHEIIVSEFILEEVGAKLKKKFKFPISKIAELSKFVRENSCLVEPILLNRCHSERSEESSISSAKIIVTQDPDDDQILATAIAGRAHCLITGDKALQALHEFRKISILSPTQFWKF